MVTYWHVELDCHDIILAENLPAESYLEMGNCGFFVEADLVAIDASPDAPSRTHADFCRPFHDAGPLVEAVRAGLAIRAGQLAATLDGEVTWTGTWGVGARWRSFRQPKYRVRQMSGLRFAQFACSCHDIDAATDARFRGARRVPCDRK